MTRFHAMLLMWMVVVGALGDAGVGKVNNQESDYGEDLAHDHDDDNNQNEEELQESDYDDDDDQRPRAIGYKSSKALLICVDETDGSLGAPSLNGMAKNDCDMVESSLKNMKFETNRLDDAAATTGSISKALLEMAALRDIKMFATSDEFADFQTESSRRVVVFWVGHGLKKVGTGHLMTYDGFMPMASIKDYAQVLGAYSQLWIFDACYSGHVLSSGMQQGPEAAHVDQMGKSYLDRLENQRSRMPFISTLMHRPAVFAMTSSTYTQTSKGKKGQNTTTFAGNVAKALDGALFKKLFSARKLFDAVREDTFNTVSEQNPQFGRLTSDSTGMFYFCGEPGALDCSQAPVKRRPKYNTETETVLKGSSGSSSGDAQGAKGKGNS